MNFKVYLANLSEEYLDKVSTENIFKSYKEKYPDTDITYNYARTLTNNVKKGKLNLKEFKNDEINKKLEDNTIKITASDDILAVITKKEEETLLPLVIETFDSNKIELPPNLAMKTNTLFDEISSNGSGFIRGSVDITVGKPGSGKSFSLSMLAVKAKKVDPSLEIGYIHFEMRRSEWLKMVKDFPALDGLRVVFMQPYYGNKNLKSILQEALEIFDIVIVDSIEVAESYMRETYKITSIQANNEIIDLMLTVAEEKMNSIQGIQQINKDGTFKGGTKLIHMTSSLKYCGVEGNDRYIEFEKNRNAGDKINRKAYTKLKNGEFSFDDKLYKRTYDHQEDSIEDLRKFLNKIDKS